ncbi:MAG TPA: hemolysin family protein [Gemmatimonadaceae bacterium]|nr:hemolysin family protein [Gemmatimonadaceae bacterium]
MSAGLVISLAATAVAALTSAADAATLTADDEASEPPSLHGDALRNHRVLAFTKVAAQLVAGAAAARAIGFHRDATVSGGMGIAAVLFGLLIVETAARSIGATLGPTLVRQLHWLPPTLDRLLFIWTVPAARVDVILHHIFAPPPRDDHSREEASEQFRAVVSAEAEVSGLGVLLLEGALSLATTAVSEVMVPRVDIVGIDVGTPWGEVVETLRRAEHARLPVYAETLDDIRGVLYAKDLLGPAIAGSEPTGGWQRLIRQAAFVPATKPINALLAEFRATRTHIAMVLDEYGGTAGLVTIENILEEIVGDIRDEHDVEEPDITRREAGRIWISGRASLSELSELLGHTFETDDNATTVGGWVFERLGRVPQPGEEFVAEGFRVVVERVRRRAVDRVYLERTVGATV